MRINGRPRRRRSALLMMALCALIVGAVGTTPAAAAAPTSPAGPGHIVTLTIGPNSIVGLVCQGEFVVPSITNGTMMWGAEQSCTEKTSQSFSLVLVTSYGTVGVANAATSNGNQIYTHQYTKCQSTASTQYVEQSYAYVAGHQVQRYPTDAVFTEPCRLPTIRTGCSTPSTSLLSPGEPMSIPATGREDAPLRPSC